MDVYIYIYIYNIDTYVYMYIYVYICIYICIMMVEVSIALPDPLLLLMCVVPLLPTRGIDAREILMRACGLSCLCKDGTFVDVFTDQRLFLWSWTIPRFANLLQNLPLQQQQLLCCWAIRFAGRKALGCCSQQSGTSCIAADQPLVLLLLVVLLLLRCVARDRIQCVQRRCGGPCSSKELLRHLRDLLGIHISIPAAAAAAAVTGGPTCL